jgi:hypothetical protein
MYPLFLSEIQVVQDCSLHAGFFQMQNSKMLYNSKKGLKGNPMRGDL